MQAQACSIKVEIIDQSDVTKLKGIIAGPPDTPFEGQCALCFNVITQGYYPRPRRARKTEERLVHTVCACVYSPQDVGTPTIFLFFCVM